MASTETQRHTAALDADAAGRMIARGGVVAFPTETVYGLGADATDPAAVARIFAAKGRPAHNPLIVHVADLASAERLAVLDGEARLLASRFWPGPLTLVAPLRDGHGLAPAVTAGLPTVALRVPAAPLAQAVLRAAGVPVAAPSANPSGRVSATTAAHVVEGLGGRIDVVLDGGPCPVGVESTIVALAPPRILREGGLATEAIEAVLNRSLGRDLSPDRIGAPGQLASHYAPSRPLRLGVCDSLADGVLLGFGPVAGEISLSATGSVDEAARRLFAALREADRMAAARNAAFIDVAPIPETGLGRAVNDRLRRAAAPRPGTPHAGS